MPAITETILREKNDLQNPLLLHLIKKKNHLFRSDDKSDNDDQLRAKERSRPLSHLIFPPYDHNRGLPSQIVFIQDSVRKKEADVRLPKNTRDQVKDHSLIFLATFE
jgi:hypothetical protein